MTESKIDAETESSRVASIRVPPYYAADPQCWLAQLEAQFDGLRITSQLARFRFLTGSLPTPLAGEIRDLIMNPPKDYPYDVIKNAIIQRTSISATKQLETCLHGITLEGRTPSQLLRQMRQLSSEFNIDDKLLKHFWMKKLPERVSSIIAAFAETASLDDLAASADKILDATPHTQVYNLSSPSPPQPYSAPVTSNDTAILVAQLQAMNLKFDNLQQQINGLQRSRSRGRSTSRSQSRSRSRNRSYCFYHNRFGSKARKCEEPCSFGKEQGNYPARQ